MIQKKPVLLLLALTALVVLGFREPPSPVAASTSAQQSDAQTVLDVLKSNEQLSDFTTLAEAAALTDNLEQDGPFTVFAPTNSALLSLELLLANSEATLTEILLYHVVNGEYTGTEVANLGLLPTLMGENIAVSVKGGGIILNGEVAVVTSDIEAANGVVHIVDAVLLPPVNSLITANQGSRELTLDQVLATDGRFTTFLSLAEKVGLKADLANPANTYTVFAPTDAAFEALTEAQVNDWLNNDEALKTLISYHLVQDTLGINQIVTDDFIPTMEGRPLLVTTDESLQVFINGNHLQSFNIVAANGVIHVVETVLIP